MEKKQLKNNMKPAVIDQILLWMIIIVTFATLLFIIVDYAAIIRLKSNNDILAQIGARMVSLGRTDAEVAASLNNIKSKYYATIDADDISCAEVTATTYQVVFNVTSTFTNTKVLTFNDTIQARVAAFNEQGSNEVTCDLTLTNN